MILKVIKYLRRKAFFTNLRCKRSQSQDPFVYGLIASFSVTKEDN